MPTKDHDDKLLATPFFFDFAVPCRYHDPIWTAQGMRLDEAFRLPSFADLDLPAAATVSPWADVRVAWSEDGLAMNLLVSGKRQPPWCRASRVEDSDGLCVWIDTRNTPGIHRANRFCHAFRFLPSGGGSKLTEPVAVQLNVDRARENARKAPEKLLKVRSEKRAESYALEAFLPTAALTGFDPDEHPLLGFTYVVVDRERGECPLAVGSEFPVPSDPSLWSTLQLIRDSKPKSS